MAPGPNVDQALRDVVRREWARVVGSVMGQVHDLDIAEDAAQDALAAALESWPTIGIPDNPGAWLTTVARRRAVDHVRRQRTGTAKHELAARLSPGSDTESDPSDDMNGDFLDHDRDQIRDDELRLVFLCCHPSLAPESQVALTLRSVAGLTTAEIARAYLVAEATMAQRLVRAKKKVRVAGVPFSVPDRELLAERVQSVLAVVYLIFNEGYAASAGDELVRTDLCDEAIRLARLLAALLPTDNEVRGLLALLLLTDARRDARVSAEGELVLLENQDRRRWHADEIAEARRILDGGRATGPYSIQASIAAVHAAASSFARTNWSAIVALYDRLLDVSPSPVVALNRAVAVALADGPEPALELVDTLDAGGGLAGYHLLHTTRADLLRRLGRTDEATDAYRRALALVDNRTERAFLLRRLAEVEATNR
jgi:RNA polymerase sigma-70 factor (ECF subfamily)